MHSTLHRTATMILAGIVLSLPQAIAIADDSTVDLHYSWEGYRIARYRSPTPAQAEGGQRIDTLSLQALLAQRPRPALIDVQPVRWQDGIFLQSKPRHNLPNSLWLPNVGLGELSPDWADYFRRGLESASFGSTDFPLVFYCTADCWMSWNAVKRAAEWGYTQVYWYAEGTDGWKEADLPLEKADPLPFPLAVQAHK